MVAKNSVCYIFDVSRIFLLSFANGTFGALPEKLYDLIIIQIYALLSL